MPWKECRVVDDRLRFVARLLDGEKMAPLCKEFGISRKTGYKIYDRYRDVGVQGLADRSRRPYRHANQLPLTLEKWILRLKREYPHWGGAQDSGATPAPLPGCAVPRDQHRPRRPGSPRSGDTARPAPAPGARHTALAARPAQ